MQRVSAILHSSLGANPFRCARSQQKSWRDSDWGTGNQRRSTTPTALHTRGMQAAQRPRVGPRRCSTGPSIRKVAVGGDDGLTQKVHALDGPAEGTGVRGVLVAGYQGLAKEVDAFDGAAQGVPCDGGTQEAVGVDGPASARQAAVIVQAEAAARAEGRGEGEKEMAGGNGGRSWGWRGDCANPSVCGRRR